MKKLSWQRISILGVVLMGASAVTAAVLPSKAASHDASGGSLTAAGTKDGTVAVLSCTFTADAATPCTVTVGSATTISGAANSFVDGFQTVNNTTTV